MIGSHSIDLPRRREAAKKRQEKEKTIHRLIRISADEKPRSARYSDRPLLSSSRLRAFAVNVLCIQAAAFLALSRIHFRMPLTWPSQAELARVFRNVSNSESSDLHKSRSRTMRS